MGSAKFVDVNDIGRGVVSRSKTENARNQSPGGSGNGWHRSAGSGEPWGWGRDRGKGQDREEPRGRMRMRAMDVEGECGSERSCAGLCGNGRQTSGGPRRSLHRRGRQHPTVWRCVGRCVAVVLWTSVTGGTNGRVPRKQLCSRASGCRQL